MFKELPSHVILSKSILFGDSVIAVNRQYCDVVCRWVVLMRKAHSSTQQRSQ